MFVGVVALQYQHHVDNGVPQLHKHSQRLAINELCLIGVRTCAPSVQQKHLRSCLLHKDPKYNQTNTYPPNFETYSCDFKTGNVKKHALQKQIFVITSCDSIAKSFIRLLWKFPSRLADQCSIFVTHFVPKLKFCQLEVQ